MAVYQIIIVLITIMLGLTLKLKNVEFITTEKVIRGKRTEVTIKKINKIEIQEPETGKRKEIKVLGKNDIQIDNLPDVEVKQPERKGRSATPEVSVAQTDSNKPKQDDKPKPMYSTIKRK